MVQASRQNFVNQFSLALIGTPPRLFICQKNVLMCNAVIVDLSTLERIARKLQLDTDVIAVLKKAFKSRCAAIATLRAKNILMKTGATSSASP
jgi:hypothetical protein